MSTNYSNIRPFVRAWDPKLVNYLHRAVSRVGDYELSKGFLDFGFVIQLIEPVIEVLDSSDLAAWHFTKGICTGYDPTFANLGFLQLIRDQLDICKFRI